MKILLKLIRSLAVWYVYFPHVALLRWLGPRAALVLARGVAGLLWLVACLRPAGRLKQSMARVLPTVRPDLRVGAVLWRHVVMKQQFFVERQLYATARGRRFVARTYADVEGRAYLEAALAERRGVLLVALHFGMGRMLFPALQELGYPTHHHMILETIHAGRTLAVVEQAVTRKKIRDEEAGGLKVIYHRPGATFQVIAELLSQNEIVGIAGDGLAGSHFVDVPFLGGRMAFPTGPARLAAKTGAALVPAVCLLTGLARHQIIFHPPLHCREDDPESMALAVRTYAGVLEDNIRRYPWDWWTWRRLQIQASGDGTVRYVAGSVPGEDA